MKTSNTTKVDALSAAPLEAMAKTNTKAYHLLIWLVDGMEHDRDKLILDPLLSESMRSALQDLAEDKLLNWLIHSGVCEHSGARTVKLDSRHLSGDSEQDAAARRERRKQFKEVSAKKAIHGRIREPKAIREMTDAQLDYLM